jgi:hypothetical protein
MRTGSERFAKCVAAGVEKDPRTCIARQPDYGTVDIRRDPGWQAAGYRNRRALPILAETLCESVEHFALFVFVDEPAGFEYFGDAAGLFDRLEIHARFGGCSNGMDFNSELRQAGFILIAGGASAETDPGRACAESFRCHGDMRGFSAGHRDGGAGAIDFAERERRHVKAAIERRIRADAHNDG